MLLHNIYHFDQECHLLQITVHWRWPGPRSRWLKLWSDTGHRHPTSLYLVSVQFFLRTLVSCLHNHNIILQSVRSSIVYITNLTPWGDRSCDLLAMAIGQFSLFVKYITCSYAMIMHEFGCISFYCNIVTANMPPEALTPHQYQGGGGLARQGRAGPIAILSSYIDHRHA